MGVLTPYGHVSHPGWFGSVAGVLNVGQKSVMNTYLNDQLMECGFLSSPESDGRDARHHPFLLDLIAAGNADRPLLE